MKNLSFSIMVFFLLVSCAKTIQYSVSDGFIKSTSKRDKEVTYYYRTDSTLKSVSYYTELKIVDSIYIENEKGELVFQGTKNQQALDSMFIYNKKGVLTASRHFPGKLGFYQEQPVKQVTYWPNGNRDSVLYITRIDTIETPSQYSLAINIDYVFSGNALKFYESGKLKSRGPYEGGKPSGVWVYYLESGIEEKRDTL